MLCNFFLFPAYSLSFFMGKLLVKCWSNWYLLSIWPNNKQLYCQYSVDKKLRSKKLIVSTFIVYRISDINTFLPEVFRIMLIKLIPGEDVAEGHVRQDPDEGDNGLKNTLNPAWDYGFDKTLCSFNFKLWINMTLYIQSKK